MRLHVHRKLIVSALLAGSLAGCHSANPRPASTSPASTAPDSPAAKPLPVAKPVDPSLAGTVQGTVSFKGKAPERVSIDMSMDPACALAAENRSEPIVVEGGHLANVYVYLKGVPESMAAPGSAPVVLDQKGCRFVPHVVAVQQGGSVEFRNSDPTMHNVHTTPTVEGEHPIDVSQGPRGAPEVHRFDRAETMLPVRCNNHPWMNAFVNVAPSPFFGVSGSDGSFTISGVPAGTYTLVAVHEKLGEQDVAVTVTAKGKAAANVTFAGK